MREQMEDDFRSVIADAVDGQRWAVYAGPGEAVRRRWQRRRRMMAAGSVGAMAVVAAAAVGIASALGGGGKPVPAGPVTVKIVDTTRGLLKPADIGSTFSRGSTPGDFGEETKLAGGAADCGVVTFSLLGPSPYQMFRGTVPDPRNTDNNFGPTGTNEFLVNEMTYQLPTGTGATVMSAERQQDAVCAVRNGAKTSVTDLPQVGYGAYVITGTSVGERSVVFRVGDVIVRMDILCGGAGADVAIPGGDTWVAELTAKAAAAMAAAPTVVTTLPSGRTAPPTGVGSHSSSAQSLKPLPGSPDGSLPASEPVYGNLLAPADLGPGFTANQNDTSVGSMAPGGQARPGMLYRGTITGGDGELLVDEGSTHYASAAAASAGLSAYDQLTANRGKPQPLAGAEPDAGTGDEVWIKHWSTVGGVTVGVRFGSDVMTINVLGGGVAADQPIPGGDAWILKVVQAAVGRDAPTH